MEPEYNKKEKSDRKKNGIPARPDTVFICYYRNEDDSHSSTLKQWLIGLSRDLEHYGITVLGDSYWNGGEEEPVESIERSLQRAGHVLIICTPDYWERARGSVGRAGKEYAWIRKELETNSTTDRFVPVLQAGNRENAVPDCLLDRIGYDLTKKNYEKNLPSLARGLVSGTVIPPLGDGPTKTLPKDLTEEPPLQSEVIGRDSLVDDLKQAIRRGHRLIVNGMGGIGKTALVGKAYRDLRGVYDSMGWLKYRGSVKRTILDCLGLFLDITDEKKRWNAICDSLFAGSRILLVFDGADIQEDGANPLEDRFWKTLRLKKSHLDIILTTRINKENPDSFIVFPVGELSIEDNVKVFWNNISAKEMSEMPSESEEKIARDIVKAVHGNTLAVELMAEVAKQELSVSHLYEELKKGYTAIGAVISHGDRKGTVVELLKSYFNIDHVKGRDILLGFACMPPNTALKSDFLEEWFGYEEAVLTELAEGYGLLEFRLPDKTFTIHPFIRDVVRMFFNSNGIAPFGTAAFFLTKIKTDSVDALWEGHPTISDLRKWIDLVESVIDATGGLLDEDASTKLLLSLAVACGQACLYTKSAEYYSRLASCLEIVFDKENSDLSYLFNTLALRYRDAGGADNLSKALEFQQKSIKLLEGDPHVENRILIVAYNNLALIFQDMGGEDNLEKALASQLKAIKIGERDLPPEDTVLIMLYNNLASIHKSIGGSDHLQENLKYQKKAVDIMEKQPAPDLSSLATFYNNLATTYQIVNRKGSLKKALYYQRKALRIRKKILGPEDRELAKAYHNLANDYFSPGEYRNIKKALALEWKAVGILKKSLGPEHPDMDAFSHFLSVLCLTMGDEYNFTKFLKFEQERVDALERILDSADPRLSNSYFRIGAVCARLGGKENVKEAVRYFQMATAIMEKYPEDDSGLEFMYRKLVLFLKYLDGKGNLRKAAKYQRKIARIRKKTLGPAHPDLASSYVDLSETYESLGGEGDIKKALKYLHMATDIFEKNLPPIHETLSTCYFNLGLLYSRAGSDEDLMSALKYELDATRISEAILGPTDPSLTIAYHNIVELCSALGGTKNLIEALKYNLKSISIYEKKGKPGLLNVLSEYETRVDLLRELGGDDNLMETLKYQEKYVGALKELVGADSLRIAAPYLELASSYYLRGGEDNLSKAMEYTKVARDILEKNPASPVEHLVAAYSQLSAIFMARHWKDDLEEVLTNQEKCVRAMEMLEGSDSPDLAIPCNLLAALYAKDGKPMKALENAKRVVRILESNPDSEDNLLSTAYGNLADIYIMIGGDDNLKEAEKYRELSANYKKP